MKGCGLNILTAPLKDPSPNVQFLILLHLWCGSGVRCDLYKQFIATILGKFRKRSSFSFKMCCLLFFETSERILIEPSCYRCIFLSISFFLNFAILLGKESCYTEVRLAVSRVDLVADEAGTRHFLWGLCAYLPCGQGTLRWEAVWLIGA